MTTENQEINRDQVVDLVLRAQNGDREAFGELAVRFEGAVFAMALRRLGNETEAEELVQDVFIQVMRKIGQLREPAAFAGWIRQITTRMALNVRTRRRPVYDAEPETLEATCMVTNDPAANAEEAERAEQVRTGLAKLRDMDRETLEAFYVRGQSLDQMSHEFGSPIGTIKRRLHVARKRLAMELDGEELSSAV